MPMGWHLVPLKKCVSLVLGEKKYFRHSNVLIFSACILKLLRTSGIDYKEWIPPALVAGGPV
jgi:hypothetical protein